MLLILSVASSMLQPMGSSALDSFAKVEAALKASDLPPLPASLSVASSMLQTMDSSAPDDGFAKVEAKLKVLQDKIKADTAKFEAEAKAGPSSFLQDEPADTDLLVPTSSLPETVGGRHPLDFLRNVPDKINPDSPERVKHFNADMQAMRELREHISSHSATVHKQRMRDLQEAHMHADSLLQTADLSAQGHMLSLLQTMDTSTPDDGFAKVEAKLKALQAKIKADTAKFEAEAKAGPSSFLQDEPADTDLHAMQAKLASMQQAMSAEEEQIHKEVESSYNPDLEGPSGAQPKAPSGLLQTRDRRLPGDPDKGIDKPESDEDRTWAKANGIANDDDKVPHSKVDPDLDLTPEDDGSASVKGMSEEDMEEDLEKDKDVGQDYKDIRKEEEDDDALMEAPDNDPRSPMNNKPEPDDEDDAADAALLERASKPKVGAVDQLRKQ